MNIFGRVIRRIAARSVRGVYRRRGFIALGAVLVAVYLVATSLNLALPDFLNLPQNEVSNAYQGRGGFSQP
jgi:hypothetical protein